MRAIAAAAAACHDYDATRLIAAADHFFARLPLMPLLRRRFFAADAMPLPQIRRRYDAAFAMLLLMPLRCRYAAACLRQRFRR